MESMDEMIAESLLAGRKAMSTLPDAVHNYRHLSTLRISHDGRRPTTYSAYCSRCVMVVTELALTPEEAIEWAVARHHDHGEAR